MNQQDMQQPLLIDFTPPRSTICWYTRLKGTLCLLASSFTYSIMSLLVSLCETDFSSSQIMLARALIQLPIALACCVYFDEHPLGPYGIKVRRWNFIRGLFGCIGNWIFYYSIAQLPLSEANALFFTNPLFTSIFGFLILNERLTYLQIFAVFGGLAGSILVSRPSFLFTGNLKYSTDNVDSSIGSHTIACFICLSGAAISSFVFLTIRHVGEKVHWSSLVFVFSLCSVVLSGLVLSIGHDSINVWPSFIIENYGFNRSYFGLLGVGVFAVAAQAFFNRGVQLETAAVAATIRQTDIVLSFCWQVVILHVPLVSTSIFGAIFIIVGASLSVIGKKTIIDAANLASSPNVEDLYQCEEVGYASPIKSYNRFKRLSRADSIIIMSPAQRPV